ncbi:MULTISPECIES: hypothetical protein [unclassified Roseovarius]|uniref:hypothetical protein n=1 Tax=unclassified Roseovarius TaxID=2614913 RepID=UPI001256E82A|nr:MULTISPECIES: hypothetical protein [unclassified Roseovarius]VVT16811.1 hypothetical protein RV420_330084 [Roseovarius sp. EC-SD190]
MSPTNIRSRQRAKVAFAKVQSQFLTRASASKEHDDIARARIEKTLRLKTAREERDGGTGAAKSVATATELTARA